jgi:hypothetical protein
MQVAVMTSAKIALPIVGSSSSTTATTPTTATATASTTTTTTTPQLQRPAAVTMPPEKPKTVAPLFEIQTLDDVLSYQTCIRYFKDYCERTLCAENLYFYMDAESYQNQPGSDFMKRTAIKICRKYIQEDGAMQINISGSCRSEILKRVGGTQFSRDSSSSGGGVGKGSIQPPPPAARDLFRSAQDEVYTLMGSDALPKFLQSKEFIELKQIMS